MLRTQQKIQLKLSKMVTDRWFFSLPHPLLRVATVYVNGDMLIIIPYIILCGVVGWLISFKLAGILLLTFYTLRSGGEMMYWFFQQFYDRKYRPFDFGLVNLSNHGIYILYQIISLVFTTISLSFLILLIIS